MFVFYRENEGNFKKKKLSGNSLTKKAKTPENNVDTNGIPERNDGGTKTKNTPSKTINCSVGGNETREISEEQDRPIKEGHKSLKDKEESREGKQKPENRKVRKTKNTPSKTINGSEGVNKSREILEEQDRPTKQGQKSLKGKEESRKGKQKQGNPKLRRLTFKEMKELAVKKRLQRQFRGARKEQLSNLSAARLASYGLTKKKKKKS